MINKNIMRIVDLTLKTEKTLSYERYLQFLDASRKHGRESILICQHKPAITAGLNSKQENLLSNVGQLEGHGITYHSIKRGGDHTAHEPGQLLVYPHLELKKSGISLSDYFQTLLNISKACLKQVWGIDTRLKKDAPGLYSMGGSKILSIGVDYRRGITGHGIALNIKNDFSTFEHIHPCGFANLKLTSIERENLSTHNDIVQQFIKIWLLALENTLKYYTRL